ncbi:MAG: insulinase family protein [Endomicrobium sp.]|nr:insulinase family protein [Endomicrobium sp.]
MESFKLKNNIKVIFKKTFNIGVVSIRIFSPVAVINETMENRGISYITSKLMTYSTKNRSNEILMRDVGNIGAELSSDASYDITGFSISCLSEYFSKAVEILSDLILNPAFDEKELLFEKQNVIAALKYRRDSIGIIASDEFSKLFYRNTSYSTSVLGAEKTVLKIDRKNLLEWYQYSYNASNILVSVAGNVDSRILKESLEKYFANIPIGVNFKEPVFNIEMAKSIKKEIKGKFNQAYIYMGFPAPALDHKDFVSIKVVNAILGGRMTSKLFVELREKLGIAYEVGTIYPSRREQSYFAIYVGLDKKNIDLTFKKMDSILKSLCTINVSEQELMDTKTYIKGIYIMDRQTVSKQSYYYGLREVIGQGYEYDNQYLRDVERVTRYDISNVANKIFSDHSLTVLITPDEK